MPRQLLGTAIAANTITTTQLQTTVVTQIQAGGGPRVSSLIYPGDDTAANTAGGQTVYVVGSGFDANANVYINGNAVPSISFISASNLAITTPALSAATYPVYVINPETGATAIHIPGLKVSGDPSWVTASGSLAASQDEASTWSYTVSATSDSAVTYALAGGSSLPTGISLAANGLISGTLSSPPGTETTYNFTVVATDAENQNASRAFSVTVSSGEGVLFANNVLLIHADGTNNQNNHTFLDSSNNNFTITRYGNATQGSFSPFSQTGWSNYFDGTGDYLSLSSTSIGDFGTGDFTVEYWANLSSLGQRNHLDFRGTGGTGGAFRCGTRSSDNKIVVGWDNADTQLISNTVPTLYTWTHIAITRSGTTCRLFFNGTLEATTTSSYSIPDSGLLIGTYKGTESTYNLIGYLSGVRIVKGTALYTSSFTPPTTPLTAVSNTQLLTCQSNRFIDASNNNFTITRNGDVSVQPFSPFAPTTSYSTANVGGSGYFDGTGDYLTTLANSAAIGTSAYTFETWAYFNSVSGQNGVINAFNNSDGSKFALRLTRFTGAEYLVLLESYPTGSTGWVFPQWIAKQWYHYVVVRNASNQTTCWVNGVRSTSGILTNSVASANYAPIDGVQVASGPGNSIDGYLSGTRLVIGSALYDVNSSTISVPTSPPTNIANTSLLLNFTNAGIFDQTAKNVLETVGGAVVSTSQYKYGTGSIYIPSSNDAAKMPGVDLLGDFTIEGWVKPAISGGEKFFIIQGINVTNGFLIGLTTSEIRWRSNGQADITAAINKSDWYHFAIVRSGSGSNNVKVYVDGTQVTQGTYTNTILASVGSLHIGPAGLVGSFSSYGYIDDFRITRGYARYTTNFTPPTSAFKDK